MCLGAQVTGQAFQSRPLRAETLGKVTGIISAGIGNRFKAHAFVADFAGHGLHGRDGMGHGLIDFGGRLFHLFGNGDAFGAGFTGGREQADGGFHDKSVGCGGAAVGAGHEARHDDEPGDERADTSCDQHGWRKGEHGINAQQAQCRCSDTDEPESCDEESCGNHPAATIAGVLEVFRRLLPGLEIPAGRAS